MKIEEMTHEEIVALDEAGINRLIKLAMAEEGLPILEEPPTPVLPEIPAEDVQVYTAEVLDEVGFKDQNDCINILNYLKGCASVVRLRNEYALGCKVIYPGYSCEFGTYEDAFNMQSITGRTASQFRAIKDILERRKGIESEHKKDVEAYNKSIQGASNIRAEIYSIYREHLAIDARKEMLKKKFAQYLELAEGNANIAMNFLAKVETLSDEDRVMLLEKIDTNTLEEYK